MTSTQAFTFALSTLFTVGTALAEIPAKVDFGWDLQPLLPTHCVDCHGPNQKMGNFRLGRRADALRGGTMTVINPRNSTGSRLYHRLIGSRYGTQIPPTGPLAPGQVNLIRAWIDQGAEWPDEASGEGPRPPEDRGATALMDAIRSGDESNRLDVCRALWNPQIGAPLSLPVRIRT